MRQPETANEQLSIKSKIEKAGATVAVVAGMLGALAAPAAAKGPIGEGFSSAAPGTVGPGISGEIYGNTSNPSGNGEGVLPSLAPGPWACDYDPGCDGPTDPGGSMGDFLSPLASGGQSQSEFANGNDQDIDFSN
jgi:hypothetical protein